MLAKQKRIINKTFYEPISINVPTKFTGIQDSGIAPFPINRVAVSGKLKVHPMANKVLKTALHMCALRVTRHPGEIKSYFARKVAEGKNKMCVLNAIRNKLLHRVFASVRDQRMYANTYMLAA